MSPFQTDSADEARSVDVPEADRAEQMTPADVEPTDEGDGDDRDETAGATPLEVDPADAVEQRLSVPLDEDYPRE